jgi:hypothetical protein
MIKERCGRQRSQRTDENVEKVKNLAHLVSQSSLLCGNTEVVT